jgi:hypothetical protein
MSTKRRRNMTKRKVRKQNKIRNTWSEEQNGKRKEEHKKTTYKDYLSYSFIPVQSLTVWPCG